MLHYCAYETQARDSMDLSTVYIKTVRGSEEIASRSHGLSSRARAMLIMVDGRRSAAILLAQSSERAEAESHLAALLDGGFIAAVAPSVPTTPPVAPPTQAPVQATLAVDLATIKHYISSTLHDTLGPDADMFTMKVEAAKNMPELLTLSEKLVDVIRGVGGKRKADDFKEKISAMLS
jgi:hypothetical protein